MSTFKTTLHLAATKEKLVPDLQPVVFLAGPIRNAMLWHDYAMSFFVERNIDTFIGCPTRKSMLSKDLLKSDDGLEKFPRQRAWEIYYLDKAAHEKGVILFFLAKEMAEPKEHPEKVYGHITQMELGKWVAMAALNPTINLVIGIDPEYPEADTIAYDIKDQLPKITIHNNLRDCCDEVVNILENNKKETGILVKRFEAEVRVRQVDVTVKEFKELFLKLKPTKVFNVQYSDRQHLYELLKYNKSGVSIMCTNWADKTPKYYTWKAFYNDLYMGGLSNVRIE